MFLSRYMPFLLRGSSAAVKFLFVLYIGYFYDLTLTGEYALVVTILAMFLQLIGFEIHNIINRELFKYDKKHRSVTILVQYITYLFIYILFSPAVIILLNYVLNLDFFYLFIFYFILCSEHLFSEVFRSQIAFLKLQSASVYQFVRTVPYLVVVALFYYFYFESIKALLVIWFSSNLIIIFVLCYQFRSRILGAKDLFDFDLGLNTIKVLFYRAKPFYFVTVIMVIYSSVDKIIISKYLDDYTLGVYYLLMTFSTIITLLVSFTVGVKEGPRAIKIFSEDGVEKYFDFKMIFYKKYIYVLLWSVILNVFIFGVYVYLKQDLQDFIILYLILLLSTCFSNLANYLKLDAYLFGFDIFIMKNNLNSLVVFFIGVFFTLSTYGVYAIAIMYLLSNMSLCLGYKLKSNRIVASEKV
jgi:hypothetical protein